MTKAEIARINAQLFGARLVSLILDGEREVPWTHKRLMEKSVELVKFGQKNDKAD